MKKSNLLNLRPYSWIDLFLIGFLAKFSVTKSLIFSATDIFMILGLLSLWIFFNLALELRHNYSYRATPKKRFVFLSLILAILIGIYYNPYSLIFVVISTFFIIFYLLKNKTKVLGNLAVVFRGIIQSQYFFYALMLYTLDIGLIQILLCLVIFLSSLIRSLIGDIRDRKQNRKANKKTLIVNYGLKASIFLGDILLIITISLLYAVFNWLVVFPLVLLLLALTFYRNGYVLHQLMIFVTSFTSVNLISYFTGINLIFTNLIFLGIFLNMIF